MRPLVISLAITDSSTGASLSSALVIWVPYPFPGPTLFGWCHGYRRDVWGGLCWQVGVGGVGKSKLGSRGMTGLDLLRARLRLGNEQDR